MENKITASPVIWDSKKGQLYDIPAYGIWYEYAEGKWEITGNSYETFDEALVEARKISEPTQIVMTFYDYINQDLPLSRKDIKDAEGSGVKTMSGKPHVPRELIADKDITPKEAMHRKMLRTEMDDNSFREEVTEIAWGDMTDRQPFDDEETIDKLYEYSMKAYAFDEGLSNEDLQIIWKEAEGFKAELNEDFDSEDEYPITRGIFWGGVFGLTLPWVIDQIKNRSNKEE